MIGGELLRPKQRRQIGRISALRRCAKAWLALLGLYCCGLSEVSLARREWLRVHCQPAPFFRALAKLASSAEAPAAPALGLAICGAPHQSWALGRRRMTGAQNPTLRGLPCLARPCTGSFSTSTKSSSRIPDASGPASRLTNRLCCKSCVASRCDPVTWSYRTKVAKQRQEP